MLNHIDLTLYLNEDIVKKVYLKHDLEITPELLEIIINYGTLTAFYD